MSRCIPFPPPGYVWNGEGGEALIELIKLNRERVEAEKERKKEKRRRKKEKRRRKKEEKRRREDGEVGQEMQNQQNRNKDGSKKRSWKKGDNEKGRKYEAQGLETSSLTEELEQPTISDCIYDSSDNSNNIKRKRVKCSPNASHNHESHFNFQLQKHKDQAALSSKPACSTPTCTDTLVQQEFEMDPRPRKDKFCSTFGLPTTAQEMASGTTREMCLSPFPTEVVSDEKAETAPALSLSESCSLQMESQYRVLIVNWVPPPLQNEHPKFDDQEWLFQRRQPRSDTIQKTNTCSYDFCHGSCILYPYAHYLPEVDIYALPYTVLF
ncbi:uncharacterized protein LOC126707093 [Quercus robur]|uniref:uncharacterized protein LOC126707093 n=1 Tax=Quercus robur TaxID=38942 RepID=UPI00216145B6|nr:uncharacterized protein LOC126707093 [Quercus robur]